MATKADRDLEDELGPSPHPLFSDRDEPWKDHELMLKLEGQHDYQYEIAHVLGCSPSKVSYWMEKAHENWSPSIEDDEFQCVYFEVCGYEVPQPEMMCPTCTSLVRHNDRQRDPLRCDSADDLHHQMERLYDEYDEYEINQP